MDLNQLENQEQHPQKRRKISNLTLQSGAAEGADSEFHIKAKQAGHSIGNYVFQNQKQYVNENLIILDENALKEADKPTKDASLHLGRSLGSSAYVRNLLRRNYFQIKNTEIVFAISDFEENQKWKSPFSVGIQGGTAWACQMFANNQRSNNRRGLIGLYLYAQKKNAWFQCFLAEGDGKINWVRLESNPNLPNDGIYTGIGSRYLTPNGKEAIEELYKQQKQ